jgi:hypothetical protein
MHDKSVQIGQITAFNHGFGSAESDPVPTVIESYSRIVRRHSTIGSLVAPFVNDYDAQVVDVRSGRACVNQSA